MEEILASIRRIIEDNESERREPQAGDPAPDRHAGADPQPPRAELKPANLQRPAQSAGHERMDPARMALHAFERQYGLPSREEPAAEEDAPEEDEDELPPVANDAIRHPASASAAVPGGRPAAFGRQGEAAGSRLTPAAEPAEPRETSGPERRALVSEAPGRKAAAAFEELNEALLEMRRKSLDQMAEEMLRPMLQDWLDNNLPQMVERLVREEIERIARGA